MKVCKKWLYIAYPFLLETLLFSNRATTLYLPSVDELRQGYVRMKNGLHVRQLYLLDPKPDRL